MRALPRPRGSGSAIRALRSTLIAVSIGCLAAGLLPTVAAYPTSPQITDRDEPGQLSVLLTDWATVPKSNPGVNGQVARINFLRSEPVAALASRRLFGVDLNGTVFVINRRSRAFTPYLHFPSIFNGTGETGIFDNTPGFAAGVVTLQFDPEYASNGKFYTVHTELGDNPGEYREAVLYEWQDTKIFNGTFEGTRALLLRVQYTDNIHPMGDIAFNPLATSAAHPDWRNMYIASGDGGAGENPDPVIRSRNQMLDNLLGKILRIRASARGTPGSYTIPADNPFTAPPYAPHARGEIWAFGFRNPHRLTWDVNPADPSDNRLLVADIGLLGWEEVNVVRPGRNYGYSRLEGNMVLGSNNIVNDDPLPATLPIYTNDANSPVGEIVPAWPVAQYSHRDGDAISSGFVYRGARIPQLRGAYVFGDITTGRLFYCRLDEMLAADDADPDTMAPIHEIKVFYDSPYDPPGIMARRIFDIARDTYDRRIETPARSTLHNGLVDNDPLPQGAAVTGSSDPYGVPYGGGRADIRLALVDGELYLLSKADGMIRALSTCVPWISRTGRPFRGARRPWSIPPSQMWCRVP